MSASRRTPDQLKLPLRSEGPAAAAPMVVSGCNAQAFAVLADWPGAPGQILALYGPTGCGKSRLGQAWAERIGAVPLLGGEAALADPLELEGRPLLLDDADAADDESLFHLINLALSGGGALLMIAREPPAAWTTALPDLHSRLAAVRTVSVAAPDDAVLAAMLRARFAERSIVPADDVIDYLVRRIDRSAEAVAAVVEALDAANRPVTRVLARSLLDHEPESGDLFP